MQTRSMMNDRLADILSQCHHELVQFSSVDTGQQKTLERLQRRYATLTQQLQRRRASAGSSILAVSEVLEPVLESVKVASEAVSTELEVWLATHYLQALRSLRLSGCVVPIIRKRRANLSNQSKLILSEWFDAHPDCPYPSYPEKEKLAERAGLQVEQVTNWFINARVRSSKWTGTPSPSPDTKTSIQKRKRAHEDREIALPPLHVCSTSSKKAEGQKKQRRQAQKRLRRASSGVNRVKRVKQEPATAVNFKAEEQAEGAPERESELFAHMLPDAYPLDEMFALENDLKASANCVSGVYEDACCFDGYDEKFYCFSDGEIEESLEDDHAAVEDENEQVIL